MCERAAVCTYIFYMPAYKCLYVCICLYLVTYMSVAICNYVTDNVFYYPIWGRLLQPIVSDNRYKLRWKRNVGFGVCPPFPIIDGSLQTEKYWESRHLLFTWMHSPPREQPAIMLWKLVENVKYEDIYEVSIYNMHMTKRVYVYLNIHLAYRYRHGYIIHI